jgi:hypothetical protein
MDEAIWGGFVAAAPSISLREKPIRLLGCSYSLNLAMFRIRRPVIVRAHMQETAISMVETSAANQV